MVRLVLHALFRLMRNVSIGLVWGMRYTGRNDVNSLFNFTSCECEVCELCEVCEVCEVCGGRHNSFTVQTERITRILCLFPNRVIDVRGLYPPYIRFPTNKR